MSEGIPLLPASQRQLADLRCKPDVVADRRIFVVTLTCADAVVAHWCTIGVSVILDGPLMHHHRCVGDLGWVADAPEVPSSHRPCRSTRGCPLRVLRGSAVPGVWCPSTGLSAVERRTVSEL